jgi:hypothetical protein
MNTPQPTAADQVSALEHRFGLRLAARLSEGADRLPHDVTERLRHASSFAVSQRVTAQPAKASASVFASSASGSLMVGSGGASGPSWWKPFAALVPLIALLLGLQLIGQLHTREQISSAAEIDAALLADDLPIDAYSDPGFVEFLKLARD